MTDGFALWLFVMTVGTLPASLMTGTIMQTLLFAFENSTLSVCVAVSSLH